MMPKLMIIKDGLDDSLNLVHAKVWDIKDILKPADLLVVNNTRVVKARLKIRLSGGGAGELLLMEPRGDGRWPVSYTHLTLPTNREV